MSNVGKMTGNGSDADLPVYSSAGAGAPLFEFWSQRDFMVLAEKDAEFFPATTHIAESQDLQPCLIIASVFLTPSF